MKQTKKENDAPTSDKASTLAERVAKIDAAIAEAEEAEDEYQINYLNKMKNTTINVYEGGIVIFQSGKPPVY